MAGRGWGSESCAVAYSGSINPPRPVTKALIRFDRQIVGIAMNDILNLTFENQPVRIVLQDGEPWFVATDVASILGYSHGPHMVRIMDDDEAAVHIMDTSGQNREVSIISESGLYNAIFKSRRAEAKAFRRWVTGTVLPTIRRTGSFAFYANKSPAPDMRRSDDAAWLNAGVAAVREARRLFGHGVARAVWRDIGLPLPENAMPALPDGLSDAVDLWTDGRDRFTFADLAAGLGLGEPDWALKRRFSDILTALGWTEKRTRRGNALVYAWHRPIETVNAEEAA
jgi:prophage antirepressor-like protein